MKNLDSERKLLEQMLDLLANQFGAKCEVVLHDLTKDYNHTIVDIRNGHITGRAVGGCGSNLGLEVLRGSSVDSDRFNYVTYTPGGKILRSSSIYIKNDEGEVIGSLCVNFDITETVHFENFLKEFNHFELNPTEEVFEQDVTGLLGYLINQAQELAGKQPEDMSKEEKMEFIQYLDRKGAFLIQKSSERVCEVLKISKFTFYNYLEATRSRKEELVAN